MRRKYLRAQEDIDEQDMFLPTLEGSRAFPEFPPNRQVYLDYTTSSEVMRTISQNITTQIVSWVAEPMQRIPNYANLRKANWPVYIIHAGLL